MILEKQDLKSRTVWGGIIGAISQVLKKVPEIPAWIPVALDAVSIFLITVGMRGALREVAQAQRELIAAVK